jgi:hypothetical protein
LNEINLWYDLEYIIKIYRFFCNFFKNKIIEY